MYYLRNYLTPFCLLLGGFFETIGSVHAECVAQQHFDGPSFVGGIVLAVGVVAIGYVMYRYFQNKRQTGMTFNDI